MFKFNSVVITKRGCAEDGVEFTTHKFNATTLDEVKAIASHPTFAGWEYGISLTLVG